MDRDASGAVIDERAELDAADARPRVRRLFTASAAAAALGAWLFVVLVQVVPRITGGAADAVPTRIDYVAELAVAGRTFGGVGWLLLGALMLWRRRVRLAIATLLAGAVVVGPGIVARWEATGAERSTAGGPTVRIATLNLAFQHDPDERTAASIRAIAADVLVLIECTTEWHDALRRWFVDDYPHRVRETAPPVEGFGTSGFEVAIWSRLEIAGEHDVLYGYLELNPHVRVPLRFDDRILDVVALHPRQPIPLSQFRHAKRERAQVLDWLDAAPDRPRVVTGDFNAPPGSGFLRALERRGFACAASAVLGYAPATFPADRFPSIPGVVALDHVFHSDDLVAVGFARGPRTGSDHVPVFADLVWR